MKPYIEYERSGDVIEIIIKDFSDRRIDRFRFNGSDKKAFARVLKTIKDVYGFYPKFPEIEEDESINQLEKEREIEKEIKR